ncbi:MAG: glycosyltransferase family 9 protein, partial [Bdellovibrionota bacterium]
LKPIIERDMDTLRALGLHVPAGRLPKVHLHESEIHAASERLARSGLPRPLLTISPGASRPSKSWPIERWAALAQEWAVKTRGGVFVAAGPDEGETVHEFLKILDDHLRSTISDTRERAEIRARIAAHAGLPIRELAAILSRASVHAGNDSGPKHLAISVGAPTVTLFGPEDPFEWHPYPTDRHPYFFVKDLPCRRDAAPGMPPWCAVETCVIEEHRCMKLIGVNAVLAECVKLGGAAHS